MSKLSEFFIAGGIAQPGPGGTAPTGQHQGLKDLIADDVSDAQKASRLNPFSLKARAMLFNKIRKFKNSKI